MNGVLTLRPRGILLVLTLELRQRIRSKRWYVALGIWTLVMLAIGLVGLMPGFFTSGWGEIQEASAYVFSIQVVLVLFALLLVVPALSAGSINGDRTAGTLATLQASLLSPLEITLGKLFAGWAIGLVFLGLATPAIIPTALLGGVPVLYFLALIVVIVTLAGSITALGLGLSAVTNRQLGSVVLAYAIVFGTTLVAPFLWGVSGIFLVQEATVTTYSTTRVYDSEDSSTHRTVCEKQTRQREVPRVDLTQPLMWPNPVVLLADVSPLPEDMNVFSSEQHMDMLILMKAGMRASSTITHPANFVSCDPTDEGYPTDLGAVPDRPIWPMGLGLWILTGVGGLAVATWRLSVPIKRLGAGTRIA